MATRAFCKTYIGVFRRASLPGPLHGSRPTPLPGTGKHENGMDVANHAPIIAGGQQGASGGDQESALVPYYIPENILFDKLWKQATKSNDSSLSLEVDSPLKAPEYFSGEMEKSSLMLSNRCKNALAKIEQVPRAHWKEADRPV